MIQDRVSFDELCERWASERPGYCDTHEGDWVVYTKDGIVARGVTESQVVTRAYNTHGEEPFIIDQVLPERPEVFIGGGFLIPLDA